MRQFVGGVGIIKAGADTVCAISATVGKPDVAADVRIFQEIINDTIKERP